MQAEPPRRSYVGTVSLVVAVLGAATTRILLASTSLAGQTWLQVVAAGFEAAVVGGLADWFAVTAIFVIPSACRSRTRPSSPTGAIA